jgi:hypothetical protein
MNKLFKQCPACGGVMVITECRCQACQMQMRGEFAAPRMGALTDDQLAFIAVFLRVRGNLSEAERVLGVSYPTVRNKLDEINSVLESLNPGMTAEAPAPAPPVNAEQSARRKREILQKVAEGALAPAEANRQIQELEGNAQ